MIVFTAVAVLCATQILRADEVAKSEPKSEQKLSQKELFDRFEKTMSGVKLVGHFTVVGQEDKPPQAEEYTILSVSKLAEGDFWSIKARIKYGDKDVTLPLPLEVKWAGDTPVITLTDLTIPGLGTFSSRVIIYNKKYAGTWTHGEVGGHIFGKVEKLPDNDS
jgi:hypothetical protein